MISNYVNTIRSSKRVGLASVEENGAKFRDDCNEGDAKASCAHVVCAHVFRRSPWTWPVATNSFHVKLEPTDDTAWYATCARLYAPCISPRVPRLVERASPRASLFVVHRGFTRIRPRETASIFFEKEVFFVKEVQFIRSNYRYEVFIDLPIP